VRPAFLIAIKGVRRHAQSGHLSKGPDGDGQGEKAVSGSCRGADPTDHRRTVRRLARPTCCEQKLRSPATGAADAWQARGCAEGDQRSPVFALEMRGPLMLDSVVFSNADPLLTSIATCLLLQASILGAGWLLQGWYLPQEAPLQSHGPSQAQAWTEAGADRPQGELPAPADGDRLAAT